MYDDMCDLSRGHCKLSGTYYFWEAEIGPLASRLQSWIQADPDFQRSDALSRRRVVLSHPVLRRYYLGKRVDIQIRGCRSVPYSPPKDMRAGKQKTLTAAHTEGIPHVEFILGGDYDEFCRRPSNLGLIVFRGRLLPSRLAPVLLGLRVPRLGLQGGGLRPNSPLPLRLRVRLGPGLAARLVLQGSSGHFGGYRAASPRPGQSTSSIHRAINQFKYPTTINNNLYSTLSL
ncbi:hypothetical protein JCGZ_12790 [Jatropha curcas]|uniref:Uncharacterized protein n=1 Tax=Jatropha curcas TaxID=180498 RepID=A0A067KQ51_JATCU|nr:hypothetical protein JCGZ_12790 [Jatropha curcas]